MILEQFDPEIPISFDEEKVEDTIGTKLTLGDGISRSTIDMFVFDQVFRNAIIWPSEKMFINFYDIINDLNRFDDVSKFAKSNFFEFKVEITKELYQYIEEPDDVLKYTILEDLDRKINRKINEISKLIE